MGYESRLYIVEKTDYINEELGKRFADDIARFDLSVFYELSDKFRNKEKTDCYIYDGDEVILKDKYGEELREANLPFVIDILEKVLGEGIDYRRIYPLLSMLRAFKDQREKWGELVVLHYGY